MNLQILPMYLYILRYVISWLQLPVSERVNNSCLFNGDSSFSLPSPDQHSSHTTCCFNLHWIISRIKYALWLEVVKKAYIEKYFPASQLKPNRNLFYLQQEITSISTFKIFYHGPFTFYSAKKCLEIPGIKLIRSLHQKQVTKNPKTQM